MIRSEDLVALYQRSQTNELPREIAERVRDATLKTSSLKFLKELVDTIRPRSVVEFGSGLSTKLLVDHCASDLRVVSVDNSEFYLGQTVASLAHPERVVPHRSPLQLYKNAGRWFVTYAPSYLEKISAPADLVLIDGPLGFFQREAPLYQILEKVARPAMILLDDSHRPYEQATLARWRARFPDLQFVDFGSQEPLTAIVVPTSFRLPTQAWPWRDRFVSYVRAIRRLVYLWNHRRKGNAFQL